MNTEQNLTKKLVAIPSFKDGKTYESKVGDFLIGFIQENFPWMTVEKQVVSENRFNVFAKDKFPTKLLVINHIDTVEPTPNWTSNPFKPFEKEGKIYGLGTSDTKGNIASFLSALQSLKETKGLAMLWYVDEEYDFLGMKEFVDSDLAKNLAPEIILSLDGTAKKFGIGCKGLIEVLLTLRGKTGHSAKPQNGISANREFLNLVIQLENWLDDFNSKFLGKSTLNIAKMQGGFVSSVENGSKIFSNEGNHIPDFLEAILEVRIANEDLTVANFANQIQTLAKKLGLEIEDLKIRHNLKPWEQNPDKVSMWANLAREEWNDLEVGVSNGYIDVAMLAKTYPKSKIFVLGAAKSGQAHAVDEFVEISELESATKIYQAVLTAFHK